MNGETGNANLLKQKEMLGTFSKEWIFEQPFEIKRVPCRPEDYPKETNWGKIKNDSVLTSEERKQYDEVLKSVKVFVNAN